MKKLSLLLLIALFASCATVQKPTYLFKQDKYIVTELKGNQAKATNGKWTITIYHSNDVVIGDTLINMTTYPVIIRKK